MHPRLLSSNNGQGVTYYMRLDSDSYILNPLCSDPFERMHQRNKIYGYRSIGMDPESVTHGMWEYVQQYSASHTFTPSVGSDGNNSEIASSPIQIGTQLTRNSFTFPPPPLSTTQDRFPGYYNNFEIVRLDAFRRPEVTTWLDDLMSDPLRIFKWRWGTSLSFSSLFPPFSPPPSLFHYHPHPLFVFRLFTQLLTLTSTFVHAP